MTSSHAAALLHAYLDTVYTVLAPDSESAFRVGDRLPFLVPAAYLTGWNPRSEPLPWAANDRANAALADELQRLGCILLPARSAAADGSHGERGWFALAIAASAADAVARGYGQNAIVHAAPGAPLRLRCYAANFGCARPPAGVDTRFVDWLP